MKIWQKISIYSLILFTAIFNIGGYFLIEYSHNQNLQMEIDRGLSEHLSIVTGVNVSMTIIKDNLQYYKDMENGILYLTVEDYLKKFKNDDIYIEVLDENNYIIFSNLDFKVSGERKELENPLVNKRKYVIRDVNNKTYLFITNLLERGGEKLKFSYIRDISYVYKNRQDQYYFFIKLDLILISILAIGVYILSKFITKPINDLIDSTKGIARGNFSERVKVNSNDEIGVLSKNFNIMTDVIENKIIELENNYEEKQRFIDNLSHELRTPLTSIIGYSDLLRSTKYNEAVFTKGLNHIFNEGKRLEKISFKLMDLVSLRKQNFEMKKENIKSLLLDIKETLKFKLEKKNIELIISGKDFELDIEKDLIEIMIINLVDNSLKASKEGDKIYIDLYKNESANVVLSVKDEGIGISKEDLKKVMEPFYMVDKARTRANNGAGLGLSICKKIADIHGAEFKVQSWLNKGTSVYIIFH